MTALILASLALAADGDAAPPKLDIPAEVRPTGTYVQLTPKTDAVAVSYVGLSGVDPLPAGLLKDSRTFYLDVRCLKPGRYKFAAVASGETGLQTRADFEVPIGTPPAPQPDVPPPPPPPNTDPLVKRFRDLLAADPAPAAAKAAQLHDLAALYAAAGDLARRSDLATVGQVAAQVAAAAKTPPLSITGLVEVRRAIAGELSAAFGNPDEVLTEASRAKLADTFGKIAAALTAAGK